MRKEGGSNVEWYIDRICYYKNLTEKFPDNDPKRRFRLYGELEAYTDAKGIIFMREFWTDGLVEFIEENIKKRIKIKIEQEDKKT